MTRDEQMAAINAASKAATCDGWNKRLVGHLAKSGLKIVPLSEAGEGDHINAPHPMDGQKPTWGATDVIVETTAEGE